MGRKSNAQKQKEQEIKFAWILSLIISCLLLTTGILKDGDVGKYSYSILSFVFGKFYYVILVSVIIKGIANLFKHSLSFKFSIGLIFINIACIILVPIVNGSLVNISYTDYLLNGVKNVFVNTDTDFGAGILGYGAYILLEKLIDVKLTTIIDISMLIIGLALLVPTEWYKDLIEQTKKHREELKALRIQEKEELKKRKEEEKARIELLKAQKRAELAEKMAREAEIHETNKEPLFEENKPQLETESSSSYFLNIKDGKVDNSKQDEVHTYKVEYQKVGAYHFPPLTCFEAKTQSKNSNINKQNALVKSQRLLDVLKQFDIDASLIATHIGPSVTKFEIKPNSAVKINRILQIEDNIKMELAAKDIRIEAPIPGRSAVGIEIPNAMITPVKMCDMIQSLPKKHDNLTFALGKDLMGKNVYCDISKMPHLLIAGATGSGKSVCINSIIVSLLTRSHPDEVKLVLVDPKKVEFTPYHDIPHLLWPVITDPKMASLLLEKLVVIMEQRYEKFSVCGVRNIASYNEMVLENNQNEENTHMDKMPYIVVIIDELSDLMQTSGKEVEGSIQRITQLARACGIHMIVATQRPSTNVITGVIKANLPSRISFATASQIDSRTILDSAGAENLLGNGDMLYAPQSESSMMRLQGVYVTDAEINNVTEFAKKYSGPKYDDTYYTILNNSSTSNSFGSDICKTNEVDPLYNEVVEFVKESQRVSTSYLQRRFGIGFNRAARIIDTMEEKGLIGPANGSKQREIFIKPDPKGDN